MPHSQCHYRRRGGGVETTPFFWWSNLCKRSSSTLATDSTGQLNVLRHDGHTLGVNGSQIGVLKEAHQVGLSSLLKSQHSAALEAQVGLEVLGNLTNQALEGQLPDQELSALLVLPAVVKGGGGLGASCLQSSMADTDS